MEIVYFVIQERCDEFNGLRRHNRVCLIKRVINSISVDSGKMVLCIFIFIGLTDVERKTIHFRFKIFFSSKY